MGRTMRNAGTCTIIATYNFLLTAAVDDAMILSQMRAGEPSCDGDACEAHEDITTLLQVQGGAMTKRSGKGRGGKGEEGRPEAAPMLSRQAGQPQWKVEAYVDNHCAVDIAEFYSHGIEEWFQGGGNNDFSGDDPQNSWPVTIYELITDDAAKVSNFAKTIKSSCDKSRVIKFQTGGNGALNEVETYSYMRSEKGLSDDDSDDEYYMEFEGANFDSARLYDAGLAFYSWAGEVWAGRGGYPVEKSQVLGNNLNQIADAIGNPGVLTASYAVSDAPIPGHLQKVTVFMSLVAAYSVHIPANAARTNDETFGNHHGVVAASSIAIVDFAGAQKMKAIVDQVSDGSGRFMSVAVDEL